MQRSCKANAWVRFEWEVKDVTSLTEGRYLFSPSFFVDGYFLRLQVGKIKWERSDGYSLALFLALDLPATGLVSFRIAFVALPPFIALLNVLPPLNVLPCSHSIAKCILHF